VVGTFKETGSGVRLDRAERRKAMALAQARRIDTVLVTELSRWGRSTTDLLATLRGMEAQRASTVALHGMAFDPSTPHGRMIATVLAGIAGFERELTQERIRSGIAVARARGKRLGRFSRLRNTTRPAASAPCAQLPFLRLLPPTASRRRFRSGVNYRIALAAGHC